MIHLCDHEGVSSPRGRPCGTHIHNQVPSILPGTQQVLNDMAEQTEPVEAQGCDWANSGS